MAASMSEELGVRFGMTEGGQVLALLACGLAGIGAFPAVAVAVGATGLIGRRLPGPVLLCCGVTAWAWWTGFFVNSFGVLTLAGPDLIRLALIVGCTWLAAHW